MKYYTHPQRQNTIIQRKDGRTYEKNWVYFRTFLRTEYDEKPFTSTVTYRGLINIFASKRDDNKLTKSINQTNVANKKLRVIP